MIKHIIMLKLNDNSEKNCNKTVEVIESMNGNVESIINVVAKKDFLRTERSYDVIFCVDLKDEKSLDEYQNDEYHINVVKKFIGENANHVAVVDLK